MKITKRLALIIIAGTTGTLHADPHPCDTCPLGEVHGDGLVSASYTLKVYESSPGCELVLCSRIDLTGSVTTNGVSTYDTIDVPLEGARFIPSDTCCAESSAATTVDMEGTVSASFIAGTLQADAFGTYWREGFPASAEDFFVDIGTASCTSFSKTEIWWNDSTQYIQTFTITFTGGECVEDQGNNDDDPPDDEPPNDDPPDDDPDPPNDDPPIDPPDDPTPPTPPDPPDEPPATDPPIPPDPPLDDLCCAAITSRLDILAEYMATAEAQRSNTNTILHELHVEADKLYDSLIANDYAILPYMKDTLHNMRLGQIVVSDDIKDIEAQVRDIENIAHSMYDQDRERYEQEVFRNIYLQQILSILQSIQGEPDDGEPPDTDPPDDLGEFVPTDPVELEQPDTIFQTSRNAFRNRLVETGKVVRFFDNVLEDREPQEPESEYTTPSVTVGDFTIGSIQFEFDYQEYTGVRALVHGYVIVDILLSCMVLAWLEGRKQ